MRPTTTTAKAAADQNRLEITHSIARCAINDLPGGQSSSRFRTFEKVLSDLAGDGSDPSATPATSLSVFLEFLGFMTMIQECPSHDRHPFRLARQRFAATTSCDPTSFITEILRDNDGLLDPNTSSFAANPAVPANHPRSAQPWDQQGSGLAHRGIPQGRRQSFPAER